MKRFHRHGYWYAAGACLLAVVLFLAWPPPAFRTPFSAVLYAADGSLLSARVAPDGQWRFPPRRDVPERVSRALVAFEDSRFFYHPGVDPVALARAAWNNLQARRVVSGGSTVTMQVARLMHPDAPRSVGEKIRECIEALRLECHYSKKEILALYVSHAPFGGNVVGLDAAAWRYFGRSADDLSWGEAALLAVLPNAPSLMHPGRNREQLKDKRNRLLERLAARGVLSEESCRLAQAEPLPDAPAPLPFLASHLLDRLALEHPGEAFATAVDASLQRSLEALAVRYAAQEASNHVRNLAVLVLDVHTLRPVAYVGNVPGLPDAFSPHVDLIAAPRSTGSILKPLLYAAMLDDGMLTPDMLVSDIPFQHDGFSPQNYSKTFDGAVPAHSVLERSLNVPAVRMLQQYGYERFHALLRNLGLSTLVHPAGHYGLSLILGGAECTLWDITGIYARMAAALNRYASGDADGGGLISPAASYLAFDALSHLNRPEEESSWQLFSTSRKVAWKTGTSYGNRDAWSVGVTPDYAVGVWVGNASGEGRPELTGIHDAAPLLFEVFRFLPSTGWFIQPEADLEEVRLCAESGFAAAPWCPHPVAALLPRNDRQLPVCPYHAEITVSADSAYRADATVLPPGSLRNVSWFVLPPAEAWYYRQHHADYLPLPPPYPGMDLQRSDNQVNILYPQPGTVVVLPRQADGTAGELVVRAVHARPEAVLYYHLNGRFAGSTSGTHRLALRAEAGDCVLTVVDEAGNSAVCRFSAK